MRKLPASHLSSCSIIHHGERLVKAQAMVQEDLGWMGESPLEGCTGEQCLPNPLLNRKPFKCCTHLLTDWRSGLSLHGRCAQSVRFNRTGRRAALQPKCHHIGCREAKRLQGLAAVVRQQHQGHPGKNLPLCTLCDRHPDPY